ncbi:MAG: fibronectin type III domain-containing protein [Bacteroidaceae bacterium]|nr:fibronectin type III domain-containing protein [Bacteroidaceae bacterium]
MKTKLLRTFVALLLTTLANLTAWAADTEPPTVGDKRVFLKNVTDNSISVKWNLATDNTTSKEDVEYTIVITNDNGYKSTHIVRYCTSSTEFTGLRPNTTYEINITAKDISRNVLKYAALTVTTKADTKAPTVENKKVSVFYEKLVQNWTNDREHTSQITLYYLPASDNCTADLIYNFYYKKASESNYYKLANVKYQNAKTITNNDSKSWLAYIYDLKPNTYDFLVEAQDAAGNTTKYDPARITVPESSSANPPTIPDPNIRRSNITHKSADLSWNRAIDKETSQSNLWYRVGTRLKESDLPFFDMYANLGSPLGMDMTSTKAYFTKPNTWYEIRVDAFDDDKNISTYEIASVKTMPLGYENDKEAPTLSNKKLTITNASDNSLTLNWTKAKDNLFDDEDLDYTVMYKEPSSGRYSKDGAEQGKNISSSHISSLQPNTTYEFRVRVKDRMGNTSTYDIVTHTTSNAQDRTAPTISNKTVTATGTTYGSVSLSWNKATDNVTKQENLQYSVYRDGVLCQKVKDETSCIVGDLKPSTRYTFEVRVEDEAGNISRYNTVQATTTAKPVTVTKYPLFIEGTQVTSANANDFWEDGGTIKYDPTTKTLHLNWADLYSTSNALVINDDITINLVGWTTISGNINANSNSKVTIKADSKYGENAQLKIQGWFYCNCDLAIRNECTVEIDATSVGLAMNSHKLSIYGSTLKVKGNGQDATVTGISALSMTDCRITSDHKYDQSNQTFMTKTPSPIVARDEIVISTEIIKVPVLVNDEIYVEGVTEDGALLSWVEATDDSTPQSELVYTLYTMRRYGDTDYSFYKDGKNFTSCKLYNLKPNTEYYAMVRVEDKEGHLTFYKETSFTTLPESDKTAPTLSNSAINVTDVTDNSVSISWDKASDDSTAQDSLYYTAGYSGEQEQGGSSIKRFVSKSSVTLDAVGYGNNMTSCTIDNLEPETSYDFYVVVYDEASNGTTYTKKTVVTKALPDITAPSLGEITISVDDLTRTSITLSWNLATDDRTPQDKLVYYVEYRKAGESAWITRNAGNTNIHTIDGLTEDTDYEVSIKVADEAGNAISYGQFTLTTTAPSAIDEVTVESVDGKMYSTSGIRVDKNFRGIIIKNGKKVMVK